VSTVNVVNRILAVLLALALLLGGLLAVIEIVRAQLGQAPWVVPYDEWSTWLGTQTWDTTAVRAGLIAIGVVGLLLLLAAVRRGRPAGLALRTESAPPGVRTTASRRGIEKTLESAARDLDGVNTARASVGRRRAAVRATTMPRTGASGQEVREAVTKRLTELGLERSLRLGVTTTREGGRR
jgi:hypothetical protein